MIAAAVVVGIIAVVVRVTTTDSDGGGDTAKLKVCELMSRAGRGLQTVLPAAEYELLQIVLAHGSMRRHDTTASLTIEFGKKMPPSNSLVPIAIATQKMLVAAGAMHSG